MKKRMIALMLIMALVLSVSALAAPGASGERGGNRTGGGRAALSDEAQAVIDEVADDFIQETFVDEQTGIELEYSLFIPADYDGTQAYPMIMYIPDSTGSGLSAAEIVSSYYGAAVWAGEEDQAKHPCFVLVPAFSGTVVDDNWNTSEQIEVAVRLIGQLTEEYAIDTDRLYTTGQSMGCMTSLYLNSVYPDLFAASLFVSGQWDIGVLQPLENATFVYITSNGDSKASGGLNEVIAMFDADGAEYSYAAWDPYDDIDTQNAAAEALLAQGTQANMIHFEAADSSSDLTHMQSFDYAYQLTAVRDWLFEQ